MSSNPIQTFEDVVVMYHSARTADDSRAALDALGYVRTPHLVRRCLALLLNGGVKTHDVRLSFAFGTLVILYSYVLTKCV